MVKKMTAMLISALMVMPVSTFAQGNEEITVYIDGIKQEYDATPIIENDRTLVPMRGIFEALGADVSWDGETRKITATRGIDTIQLTVGKKEAVVNGETVKLDKEPIIVDDRTLVPIRFVSEALEAKVTWEGETQRVVIGSKENDEKWWYRFPTQSEAEGGDQFAAKGNLDVNARSYRLNLGADCAWGHVAQRKSYEEALTHTKGVEDKKIVTYFEAGGTGTVFAIGYNRNADGTYTKYFPKLPGESEENPEYNLNSWGWNANSLNAKGINVFDYTGMHLEVNDSELVGEDFKKEALGVDDPYYPDGTSAVGYDESGDLPYPLNARVYDSTMGKDFNGKIFLGLDQPREGADAKGLMEFTVGSKYLPSYQGKEEGEKVSFGFSSMFKDLGSPFWESYDRASAREWAKYGLSGAWIDNYSPWDNFQIDSMFGDWAVANFNTLLKDSFTTEQLKEMGINDINTFSIRDYMKEKAAEMGEANPEKTTSPVYLKDFWLDDPVWNAFKVSKMKDGRNYLQTLYKTIKEETKDVEGGFMVSGNDMPKVNHGWVDDSYLDVVAVEVSAGWDLTFGGRGIGLPPFGKMAIFEKTAREHQKGPYPIMWFYNGYGAAGKTELGKVLLAEAFANNSFVKYAANTVGTKESHQWLNDFAYREEENLSPRYDNYDVALVFSPENQLANSVPASGSVGSDMNRQYHVLGHWGFGQAMVDAHIQYRTIPDWKLKNGVLQGVKTLIIPNMEAMDDDVLPVLQKFTENGGRLVLTGPVGMRKGTDGFFAKRESSLLEDLIMRDVSEAPGNRLSENSADYDTTIYTNKVGKGEVVWTAEPAGYTYFMESDYRDEVLPRMLELIGQNDMFKAISLPETVGAFSYRSTDGDDLWVDLVNYDVNEDDVVTPAQNLTFQIQLPEGRSLKKVLAIRPEGNLELNAKVENGMATVTLPTLQYYTSVKLISE